MTAPVAEESDERALGIEYLPEGWRETALDQILVSLESGSRPKGGVRGISSGIVSIGGEHLNEHGGFRFDNVKFIPQKFFQQLKRGHVRAADILIVKDGATTGKVALVRRDFPYSVSVVNEHVFVCRPSSFIHPPFVFYYLFSQEGQARLLENFRGSAQGGINQGFAQATLVPIAPLAEQKRIVAKVEELLTQVSATRERLARVPSILRRFRQAILAAACSGGLTADWRESNHEVETAQTLIEAGSEATHTKTRRGVPVEVEVPDDLSELSLPRSWSLQSVASLLRIGALIDVKDGNHGSNHPKVAELVDRGLPFITAAQVKNYQIDYQGAPKVDGAPLKRLKVGFAQIGDAILTHKGTVGRAAVNIEPCVLTPQTTYYRCNSAVLDSRYLVYFFTSLVFHTQLAAVMSQTTRDFVPISEQYRLFIFVPPTREQHEIVRRIEALFSLTARIESRMVAASAGVERLTRAIFAKAFQGKLVPTEAELARVEGRNYEPASVLLARVKTNQNLIPPTRRRKRSHLREYLETQ